MGNVLIRNLDDDVIARLKRRALEQGTSFEAVARGLLTEGSRQSRAESLAWARANAAAQPPQTSDSTEFIRTWRDGERDDGVKQPPLSGRLPQARVHQ
jgi:plasmid stability protein